MPLVPPLPPLPGPVTEAELHDVGELVPLDLLVVADDEGLAGLLGRVELHQAAGTALVVGGEPLDPRGGGGTVVREDVLEVGVLHLGHVEEVEELGGGQDPVLGRPLGVVEPVVAVLLEAHEGEGAVGQCVRVLDLGHVLLLGPVQADLQPKHGGVADVVDAVLDGLRASHLHHDAALLGLEEHDLADVPVLAEQVEDPLAVELVRLNAVDHGDGRGHVAAAAALLEVVAAAVRVHAAALDAVPVVQARVHAVHAHAVQAVHGAHQGAGHAVEAVHAHAAVHTSGHASHPSAHTSHASPHTPHSPAEAASHAHSLVSTSHAHSTAHGAHPHPGAAHVVHLWGLAEQDGPLHLHSRDPTPCELVRVVPGHLVVLLDLEPVRLGVLDLEGAAAGVDVAPVQVALGLIGALHGLELDHGVDDVAAAENDDAVNFADRRGDLVDD